MRALLSDPDASSEFSRWLRSVALMQDQPPLVQPYEILAEQHLAMDLERYLQVRTYVAKWLSGIIYR